MVHGQGSRSACPKLIRENHRIRSAAVSPASYIWGVKWCADGYCMCMHGCFICEYRTRHPSSMLACMRDPIYIGHFVSCPCMDPYLAKMINLLPSFKTASDPLHTLLV